MITKINKTLRQIIKINSLVIKVIINLISMITKINKILRKIIKILLRIKI